MEIIMSQEEKELLLKDLCARLPYGVKLQNVNTESIVKLRSIDLDDYCYEILFYTYQGSSLTICDKSKLFRCGKILRYKPYLFPLSSMTEEQRKEYHNLCSVGTDECGDIIYFDTYESIDYLNKNKFDYRYLIPMRLAYDATGLNIYSVVDGIISYRK